MILVFPRRSVAHRANNSLHHVDEPLYLLYLMAQSVSGSQHSTVISGGRYLELEHIATEPASCPCGSNVRTRALVHLVSMELFGRSIILKEFPRLKGIRALGMTDKECYASVLAGKFDYINTRTMTESLVWMSLQPTRISTEI